jgi:hypothetical protein
MAALTYISASDEIIGASHPQKTDTKNRAGIGLNTNILVEHTQAGRHDAQNYALVGEIDTYSGDDSTPRTISLSNATLTPKMLIVWRDSVLRPKEKFDSFANDESFERAGSAINNELEFATGEFTVKSASLNASGITYYYLVLGIDNTATYTGNPAAGSDPTWITSSTSNLMIGDGTGTVSSGNIGNNIESAINTLFGVAHNITTGIHTTNPYAAYGKIEPGSYGGDNTDDRDITLTNTALDVKYVVIIPYSVAAAYSRSESMAGDNTKQEKSGAFQVDRIQSLGTGTFQVGNTLNQTGETYHWIAIGV